MTGLPTGTITLLFTDIEGSTQLLQQLESRYDELLVVGPEQVGSARGWLVAEG